MLLIFVSMVAIAIFLMTIIVIGARLVNAIRSKIRTENGIQEGIFVNIGGIRQYLQIRGDDIENPVVLWLHGGPGFPSTYATYMYQTGMEKKYTVACWEQRGCGRTYYENDTGPPTAEQLTSDTDEMVEYLRGRFGKDKVIVVGQSWGSVLGMRYIHEHPEKVEAYVAVGQVTDLLQGRAHAAMLAAEIARASGNVDDAVTLEQCALAFRSSMGMDTLDAENLGRMAELTVKYMKGDREIPRWRQIWIGLSSPDMSWKDYRWYRTACDPLKLTMMQLPLVEYLYFKFRIDEFPTEYGFPVGFVQGECDCITPTDLVNGYCKNIVAPRKGVMIINDAGHLPYVEDPRRFCDAVVGFLDA